MGNTWMLLVLAATLFGFCSRMVSSLPDRNVPNYRIVHIDDLVDNSKLGEKHKRFSGAENGSVFTQFAVHSEKDSVFVGSNNSVLRLSLGEFKKVDQVIWSSTERHWEACKTATGSTETCPFHSVSLLVPTDDVFFTSNAKSFRTGLYTCLTYSSSSECTLRQAFDLRGPPRMRWTGLAHHPVADYSRVVGVATSNRYLYLGTRFSNGSDTKNVIRRIAAEQETSRKSTGPKIIETPADSNWIMQDERTVFIHAFEFHNAVYFLFREKAQEALESCQSQVVVSRIGRVCLSDNGGPRRTLESFTKATIVCPSENDRQTDSTAFVYNELQSVQVDQSSKTLFATFTTSRSMPAGSVVCAYRLTDIEDTFKGPFHRSNGEPTKFTSSGDCNRPYTNVFSNHRLMYRVLRPRQGQAILKQEAVRWSHLAVDWAPHTPKTDNNLILFTMDTKGTLSKWHVFKGQTCLLEQIQFQRQPNPADLLPVLGLAIIPATQNGQISRETMLLVATKSDVFRFPASRCGRLGHVREICETVQDPYCGWNMQTEQCETLTAQTENSKQIIRFDSCATEVEKEPKFSIDGAWGSWSGWSPCGMSDLSEKDADWLLQVGTSRDRSKTPPQSLEVHGCQCRYRLCSSPYPFGQSGKKCMDGPAVQSTNCSISGGWTAWSSWSGCEPACKPESSTSKQEESPVAVRTRQRWCLNPAPMGPDGKPCVGAGKETQPCIGPLPICPDEKLPSPSWSQWSEWSDCSTTCNGGRQLRWRQCGRGETETQPPKLDLFMHPNSVSGYLKKALCIGNAFEEQECNSQPCPVNKVTSAWTTWYVAEGDKSTGTLERRYRVECVAKVPEVDKLQATVQVQNGECASNGNGVMTCQEIGRTSSKEKSSDGPWLQAKMENRWSVWTACSRPCGGGTRYRWRPRQSKDLTVAKSSQNENPEIDRQEEACNTHSCPGHWSCWTKWSTCTEPPCSVNRGEQRRYRSCLIPSSLTLPSDEQPDINLCNGGEEHSVQSRPCEVTIADIQCRNTDAVIKAKRTLALDSNISEMTNVYTRMGEVTPWAAWSDCFRPSGLNYEIRIRAREQCPNCEVVQAKRCDSDQYVALDEILAADKTLRGRKAASSKKRYTRTHAIVVVVFAALLGIALVLIPYLVYTMTERKRKDQRDRAGRSKLWRKLVSDKYQSDRNLPYIWVAETEDEDRRPRNRSSKKSSRQVSTKNRSNWNQDELSDLPTTLHSQNTLTRRAFPQSSLTRIQALHNDHRARPEVDMRQALLQNPHEGENILDLNQPNAGHNSGSDRLPHYPNYEPSSPRVKLGANITGKNVYGESSKQNDTRGKSDNAIIYASAPCQ